MVLTSLTPQTVAVLTAVRPTIPGIQRMANIGRMYIAQRMTILLFKAQ